MSRTVVCSFFCHIWWRPEHVTILRGGTFWHIYLTVNSHDYILRTCPPQHYGWQTRQEEPGQKLQNGKQGHAFLFSQSVKYTGSYTEKQERERIMVSTSSVATASVPLAWPPPRLHAWAYHSENSCLKSHLKIFIDMCLFLFFKWMLGHKLASLRTRDLRFRPNFHRLTHSHIFLPTWAPNYSFIRQD